jgi:DNA-binding NarL/FixJ family response regulator
MATALRRSRFRIVVAETCTDSDGLRAVFNKPKTNIDIALIASHLREGPVEGLKVLRDMRSAYPKTGFIALLDSSARAIVVEAFRAGATGILSREEPFDTVCKCILAVHQGQIWASVRELKFALEALAQSEGSATTAEKITNGGLCLTKREEGVVQLVAEGLTNRDISRQLNLSENTVRNYIFRIFNKVGTSNRLELALYAINRKQSLLEQRQE